MSERVEGPIASCDYLARSLVPGGWRSHTNVVGEMGRWRRGLREVPDVVTLGNAIIPI